MEWIGVVSLIDC